ncbi:MAG TPA: hypothetical protein VKV24_06915 [Casimicrobiaceae bacterium]|nr:hypothetical protein [Casimicrobiaceae bacterium]
MKCKRTLIAVAIATAGFFAFASMPTWAQDSTAASSEASQAAIAGSGMIVDGSAKLIRAGAMFVVAGVTTTADASVIMLRDVATGSEASVRVGADALRAGSIAVGQTVGVVAEATGISLFTGARLVAFIPNEVGRALVFSARSTQM